MESQSATLNPRAIRLLVAIVCVACVAGMIVTAALKQLGGVLAFGCLSSGAIVALMAVIASQPGQGTESGISMSIDAGQAVLVESLVVDTISEGASESTVRTLVGAAVALGRSFTRSE